VLQFDAQAFGQCIADIDIEADDLAVLASGRQYGSAGILGAAIETAAGLDVGQLIGVRHDADGAQQQRACGVAN